LKRATLVGILVLLAPTAGCATFPFSTSHASPTPASSPAQAPAPNAKATDGAANLEVAIRDAQALRKAGDLGGAAKALSQLVLIAPDNALVLGEYGKNLAAQGRSDDALAFLERAIQLQPADWTLYSAQGMAYDQKTNYRAAQASYARALVLKPGEPSILNNAALSYMQAGDLDNAEKLLRQAPSDGPNYPRIAQNLALVQSLRGAQAGKTAAVVPPVQGSPSGSSPPGPVAAADLPAQPDVAQATVVVSEPVTRTQIAPPAPSIVAASPAILPSMPSPSDSNAPPKPIAPNPSVALAPVHKDAPIKAEPVVPAKPAEKQFVMPAPKLAPEPKLASADPAPTPAAAKPTEKKLVQTAPKLAAEPKSVAADPASNPSNATYFVQAGAFLSEERAGVAASALDRLGARVTPGVNDGRAIYRVRIGPFLTIQQAKAAVTQAQSMGHADLRIVTQ
jgi:Flp pilus assembly protein TadD